MEVPLVGALLGQGRNLHPRMLHPLLLHPRKLHPTNVTPYKNYTRIILHPTNVTPVNVTPYQIYTLLAYSSCSKLHFYIDIDIDILTYLTCVITDLTIS